MASVTGLLGLYGRGLAYPLQAASNGRLREVEGEESVWQSILAIADTPLGTAALDQEYGWEAGLYDVSDPSGAAMSFALAVERSEPRVSDVHVNLLEIDVENGSVEAELVVTLITKQVLNNRILTLYGLRTDA